MARINEALVPGRGSTRTLSAAWRCGLARLSSLKWPVAFDKVIEQHVLGHVPTGWSEASSRFVRLWVVHSDRPLEFSLAQELEKVRDVHSPNVVPQRVVAAPMPDLDQTDNSPARGDLDAPLCCSRKCLRSLGQPSKAWQWQHSSIGQR